MNEAQHRWEARYRARDAGSPLPCQVLAENAHLLPPSGLALDLACGTGGNALFLARRGLTVRAFDIAPTAIALLRDRAGAEGLSLRAEVRDLAAANPDLPGHDVIVVSRYLDRTLLPVLCRNLNPGGLLFYQTFTATKLCAAGPHNPDYLLRDNELLALCRELQVRYYREDARCGDLTAGRRDEAYFVGQKPNPIGAPRTESPHEHHS